MADVEELVQRTVDTVTMIAAKAGRFAGRLLLVVAAVCVGGFLLGIAALDGGIEKVWIVLGIVFGSIAIGGPLVALWRVGSVRRHVPDLVSEVRSLLSRRQDTGQTVIETFDADDPNRPAADRSAIVLTRQVHGLRGVVGSGMDGATHLTAAITALTSFPALVLVAIAISLVFGFLSLIFLLALAL